LLDIQEIVPQTPNIFKGREIINPASMPNGSSKKPLAQYFWIRFAEKHCETASWPRNVQMLPGPP